MSYTSMSYREIASRYNAINAIPPKAAAQIGAALAEQIGSQRWVLDIGAGAGRLAIPAWQAGCHVIALDLELAMLVAGDCEANERGIKLPLLQSDARQLPFVDEAVDVIMINNLLHLVEGWQQVLLDAVRVMKRGGVLLQGRDWLDPNSRAFQLRNKLRQIVGTLDPSMRPTSAAGPTLMQTLAQMGGKPSPEIMVASWHEPESIERTLQKMALRQHNETWSLDESLLRVALDQLTEWAATTWPDLDTIEQTERRFLIGATQNLKGTV